MNNKQQKNKPITTKDLSPLTGTTYLTVTNSALTTHIVIFRIIPVCIALTTIERLRYSEL